MGVRGLNIFIYIPRFYKPESIPYLSTEISALLTESFIEEYVIAGGRGEHHSHTHSIGTILIYQFQRIGTVSQRLGHLATQFIAHDTCEIDVLERHGFFVLVTCHNHARHPEKYDIRPCHEICRGIVVFYFFIAGIVDAVKEAYGPQPTTEPCIKAIRVLPEVAKLQGIITGQGTSFCQSLLCSFCNNKIHSLFFAPCSLFYIIRRYAMPPP